MSTFLERIGRAAARRPWRTIGIWVLALVVLGGIASSLGGEPVDSFRLPGSDAQRAQDLLRRGFRAESGSSAYLVFHARDGRLGGSRDEVESTLAGVRRLPDVRAVSDPFARGALSRDGTTALAEIRYDRSTADLGHDGYDRLKDRLAGVRRSGLQVEIGGPLAAWEQTGGSTELIGILVGVGVLTLVFGSILAMFLPIGTALVSLLGAQLLVALLAAGMHVPSSTPQLVVMIGLGVALDYGLFLVARYLDRVRAGEEPVVAAGQAAGTAGVAVLFAGSTVLVAICGLAISGIWAIAAMGFAVALAVAVTVVASLTLLPAFLGLLGRHANASRVPLLRRSVEREYRGSRRWATTVVRRPVPAVVAALVVLLTLAAPVLAMRLGQTDAGTQPTTTSQRRAYDLLARSFGAGFDGPLLVVVDSGRGPVGSIEPLMHAVSTTPGVAAITEPRFNGSRTIGVFEAFPRTAAHSEPTARLVRRLRDDVVAANSPTGARVLIGGETAAYLDMADQLRTRLPLLIAAVVLVSFVLLTIGFRSVVVPLKAAVMNVLSIGVGYGVIVAVFQWGWAKSLIGLSEAVPIVSWVPLLMFAILFGLSMDYEVFLISAIRAAYRRHGDNTRAVVDGLSSTARIITAAAVIMLSVFGAFVAFPDPIVKMVGLGLAVSVLVDATVVRMVLVPAAMVLLGDANWWLPGWLDRILPRVDLESGAEPGPSEPPTPAPDRPDAERIPVGATQS